MQRDRRDDEEESIKNEGCTNVRPYVPPKQTQCNRGDAIEEVSGNKHCLDGLGGSVGMRAVQVAVGVDECARDEGGERNWQHEATASLRFNVSGEQACHPKDGERQKKT